MSRLLVWTLIALLVVAVPFFIWGNAHWLQPDWLAATLKGLGPWLPAAAVGLLVADIVLPVPASVVMALLGLSLGLAAGVAVAMFAVFVQAVAAYGLARWLGRAGIGWFVKPEELARLEASFERWGMVYVIVARGLPILPEAASLLAGLGRMSFRRFLAATAIGGLPVCAIYVGLGAVWRRSAGAESSGPALMLAAAIPIVLALILHGIGARRSSTPGRLEGEAV